jgi:FkbM family methyltransferase
MHTAGGDLWFSAEGINGDRGTFGEIFVHRCYRTDYRNVVAIDVGAHKGYFGAYALLHGARAVFSYEPEELNFAMLASAAESFRARGFDWRINRAAVGSYERETELHVARNSWSHSLLRARKQEETGRVQKIEVVSFRKILEEAEALNSPLVVKVDAEGAECEIVLGTPTESWALVKELFVEVHSFAPCSSHELIEHLDMRVASTNGLLHFLGEAPPAGHD